MPGDIEAYVPTAPIDVVGGVGTRIDLPLPPPFLTLGWMPPGGFVEHLFEIQMEEHPPEHFWFFVKIKGFLIDP